MTPEQAESAIKVLSGQFPDRGQGQLAASLLAGALAGSDAASACQYATQVLRALGDGTPTPRAYGVVRDLIKKHR